MFTPLQVRNELPELKRIAFEKKKIRLIKSRHLLRVMDDEGKIYSFKVYRLFVTKLIF